MLSFLSSYFFFSICMCNLILCISTSSYYAPPFLYYWSMNGWISSYISFFLLSLLTKLQKLIANLRCLPESHLSLANSFFRIHSLLQWPLYHLPTHLSSGRYNKEFLLFLQSAWFPSLDHLHYDRCLFRIVILITIIYDILWNQKKSNWLSFFLCLLYFFRFRFLSFSGFEDTACICILHFCSLSLVLLYLI